MGRKSKNKANKNAHQQPVKPATGEPATGEPQSTAVTESKELPAEKLENPPTPAVTKAPEEASVSTTAQALVVETTTPVALVLPHVDDATTPEPGQGKKRKNRNRNKKKNLQNVDGEEKSVGNEENAPVSCQESHKSEESTEKPLNTPSKRNQKNKKRNAEKANQVAAVSVDENRIADEIKDKIDADDKVVVKQETLISEEKPPSPPEEKWMEQGKGGKGQKKNQKNQKTPDDATKTSGDKSSANDECSAVPKTDEIRDLAKTTKALTPPRDPITIEISQPLVITAVEPSRERDQEPSTEATLAQLIDLVSNNEIPLQDVCPAAAAKTKMAEFQKPIADTGAALAELVNIVAGVDVPLKDVEVPVLADKADKGNKNKKGKQEHQKKESKPATGVVQDLPKESKQPEEQQKETKDKLEVQKPSKPDKEKLEIKEEVKSDPIPPLTDLSFDRMEQVKIREPTPKPQEAPKTDSKPQDKKSRTQSPKNDKKDVKGQQKKQQQKNESKQPAKGQSSKEVKQDPGKENKSAPKQEKNEEKVILKQETKAVEQANLIPTTEMKPQQSDQETKEKQSPVKQEEAVEIKVKADEIPKQEPTVEKQTEDKTEQPKEAKLEQSMNFKVDQPTQAKVEQPTPAKVEQPTEAKVEQPMEVKVEQPTAAKVAQPTEGKVEQPMEVKVDQPSKAKVEQPTEGKVEQPMEVKVDQPSKAKVEQPTEAKVEQPMEVKVGQPTEVKIKPQKETKQDCNIDQPREEIKKQETKVEPQKKEEPKEKPKQEPKGKQKQDNKQQPKQTKEAPPLITKDAKTPKPETPKKASPESTEETRKSRNTTPTSAKKNKDDANLKAAIDKDETKAKELPEKNPQEKMDAISFVPDKLIDILDTKMQTPAQSTGAIPKKMPKQKVDQAEKTTGEMGAQTQISVQPTFEDKPKASSGKVSPQQTSQVSKKPQIPPKPEHLLKKAPPPPQPPQPPQTKPEPKKDVSQPTTPKKLQPLSDEDEEFIEYKFTPRQVFIATICQVCKIALKDPNPCLSCLMVSYCSEAHSKEDAVIHQQLCRALQEIARKRGGHVYNNAKILSHDDFRNLRVHTLNLCESLTQRSLQPFEKEILLFPRICCTPTCREWRTPLLTECQKCGQVSYCRDQPTHLPPDHQRWCPFFLLYQKLVVRQKTTGRIEPTLPSRIFLQRYELPNTMDEVFKELYKTNAAIKDDCTYATLTQLATAPLTAFYALHKAQITVPETLTIHLVGAELQFEGDTLDKWEAFFLHLIPQVLELRVVFIGPELNAENLPLDILSRIRMCRTCRQSCRGVKFDFQCGKLYHDYAKQSAFTKPDLICFFNPGLYRATGFSGLDTWPETIKAATSLNAPIIVTSYTEIESPQDLSQLHRDSSRPLNLIQAPSVNPFSSQRPERNFISDEISPMIFKNYFVFIVN
ncbi:hypothetical protein DMENIID0001_071030 [Sergentomyia squamirostris]